MAPAGGAVGGFLALRWQRKQNSQRRTRRQRQLMAVLEGAIVGTVIVLTVMLVPSLGLIPAWARTAESAWFVSAVFAGFLGLELLDRIARLFFRQRSASDAEPDAVSPTTARTTQP
jgi:sterol desaturase/sphingolipid hydroxylase (fatty acid hydroxylase superfamily)